MSSALMLLVSLGSSGCCGPEPAGPRGADWNQGGGEQPDGAQGWGSPSWGARCHAPGTGAARHQYTQFEKSAIITLDTLGINLLILF